MSVCGISTKGNQEQAELVRLIMDNNKRVVFVTGAAGTGKALKNGTNVLTIDGWKPIEQLMTSDKVAASDGRFYDITGIYPQGLKQIYKITFSDRSTIECCKDHLWFVQTASQRSSNKNRFKILTTEEILNTIPLTKKGTTCNRANCYIPICKPIEYTEQEHLIHPYLLGALLGDGLLTGTKNSIDFFTNDPEMVDLLNKYLQPIHYYLNKIPSAKYGYSCNRATDFDINKHTPLVTEIKRLNLYGTNSHTKFIPNKYKYDSIENRFQLLCGLIDTDGYCEGSSYDLCCASQQLILDVKEICESLGLTAVYTERNAVCYNSSNGIKNCGTVYRLHIKTSELFPKIHQTQHREKQWRKPQAWSRRSITNIEPMNEQAEMTCISVNSPDHSYIIENHIVTHNTFITMATAIQLLSDKRYSNIYYTRDVVQTGDKIGYLKGSITDKTKPFLMPLYDTLDSIERVGHEIKAAN